MRELVLLFDVPVFFFLTGCTFSIHPKIDPLKQMLKLITLFFIAAIVGQLLVGKFTMYGTITPLALYSTKIEHFSSFSSSYWFVPVYVVTLLYSTIIINYCKKYVKYVLLILIPIYYIYSFLSGELLNFFVLGYKVQIVMFYIWLMLLGYCVWGKDKKCNVIIYSCIFIFSLAYFVYNLTAPNGVSMQTSKFTLSLPYAIASMASIAFVMLTKNKFRNSFLEKIGSRAIYFYLSQCVGASVLFWIVPHIDLFWAFKFLICFSINLVISLSLGFLFYFIDDNFSNFIVLLRGKIECLKKLKQNGSKLRKQ